ncbi:MAG: hypothetical protein PUP93_00110 [Rhizonema sp. NSF051]|nr:hypothetical protein [Rhizonema sp. NSF051]
MLGAHVAFTLRDQQRLEAVREAAIAQLAWIDQNAHEHKMSTKSVAKRSGVNLYNSLLTQIDADLTILGLKSAKKILISYADLVVSLRGLEVRFLTIG